MNGSNNPHVYLQLTIVSASFKRRKNGDRKQEVHRLQQPCLGVDGLIVSPSLVMQRGLRTLALLLLYGGGGVSLVPLRRWCSLTMAENHCQLKSSVTWVCETLQPLGSTVTAGLEQQLGALSLSGSRDGFGQCHPAQMGFDVLLSRRRGIQQKCDQIKGDRLNWKPGPLFAVLL